MPDLFTHPKVQPIDKYLYLADDELRLISVFDDLKYDRADVDMLSKAMRSHVISTMKMHGFRQKSGNVLQHRDSGLRALLPKFHALGASPFDITRFTKKRAQDYFILTPTQTACLFVDHYDLEEAVERTKSLIAHQPINIYRLMDFLERKPTHEAFKTAIGHLRYVQREALQFEALRYMRALG